MGCGENHMNIFFERIIKYIGLDHSNTLYKKGKIDIFGEKANTGYWSTAGLRFNYYLYCP
jgi:hypothetical protein